MKPEPQIAVIGGTGFYSLFENPQPIRFKTPYGNPTNTPVVGKIVDRDVASIPRHEIKHEYPPHVIPYRANLWALHSVGVKRIIAPCAVGSLRPDIKRGDFVLCDQFINFTGGRKDTFYDGPAATHIGRADLYCPQLGQVALKAADDIGLKVRPRGTVVVIQGPRFSTRAESRFFREIGGDVINMTQYPEVVLARELEICYLNISLVTDYDLGLEGDPSVKHVTHDEVINVFSRNLETLRKYIWEIVKQTPGRRICPCSEALETARLG